MEKIFWAKICLLNSYLSLKPGQTCFSHKCLSINNNYKKNINWVTDIDCLIDLKNNSFMKGMVQHFSISKDHETLGQT